jgi:hypothetical protein
MNFFMAANYNSKAEDIQAQIYFEKATYETGTHWNGSIDLHLK